MNSKLGEYMKVVINGCYGGFSLSPEAMKMLAKKKGRECHFFKHEYENILDIQYTPVSMKDADMFSTAFDTVELPEDMSNEWYVEHVIDSRPDDRTDPDLIAVVQKLKKKANGNCAELHIVEIPDDVNYSIEEYDGIEHIAEVHRTWS